MGKQAMENQVDRPPRRLSVRRTAGIVALAGALVLSGLAVQQMGATASGDAEVIDRPGMEALDRGLSGMIVVRDPESGELRTPSARETSEFLAETSVLFDQSNVGLESERLPDGTIKLNLEGRHQNATVVAVGADGRMEVVCAEHPEQVESAVHRAQHRHTLDARGFETR